MKQSDYDLVSMCEFLCKFPWCTVIWVERMPPPGGTPGAAHGAVPTRGTGLGGESPPPGIRCELVQPQIS